MGRTRIMDWCICLQLSDISLKSRWWWAWPRSSLLYSLLNINRCRKLHYYDPFNWNRCSEHQYIIKYPSRGTEGRIQLSQWRNLYIFKLVLYELEGRIWRNSMSLMVDFMAKDFLNWDSFKECGISLMGWTIKCLSAFHSQKSFFSLLNLKVWW